MYKRKVIRESVVGISKLREEGKKNLILLQSELEN